MLVFIVYIVVLAFFGLRISPNLPPESWPVGESSKRLCVDNTHNTGRANKELGHHVNKMIFDASHNWVWATWNVYIGLSDEAGIEGLSDLTM